MQLRPLFDSVLGRLFGINNEKFFFTSQNRILGTKGAVYLDVEQPYKIFNENPSINQVIKKKSAMFSNMELVLKDKQGNIIEDKEFKAFIQKPNIYQSLNSFLRSYIEQKDVYGNTFLYKSIASSLQKYPTSLMPISPRFVKPVLSGKIFDQISLNDVIDKYEIYNINGVIDKIIETDKILWCRNTDLDNPLEGVSPLKSLKYPITNTKYAYDYLNVISGEKGAIGIISDANKSPMGGMPLKDSEKEAIERSYTTEYGIGEGQRRVIVTKSGLEWQPMSYPTKDLLLLDQIDAYFLTIVDHFGLNVNIFSTKSQTFENVKNALIQCYQDTIIPEADQFCQDLTDFLQLKDVTISASYDHVSILKESQKTDANTLQSMTNSLLQLQQSGILTNQQVTEILNNQFQLL